ncbi:hypothetical protein [Ectopseudomonas khazarica]|uniref:hypothetical protein n=1 Tax=Ectopseudomonas khazarica TaxID=2502979 RepID=UPI003A92ECEB
MASPDAKDIGCELWAGLRDTFMFVAEANGLDTPAKRAQLWAAFIGSVGGAMSADLGIADTAFIFDLLKDANKQVAREGLHVVDGGVK